MHTANKDNRSLRKFFDNKMIRPKITVSASEGGEEDDTVYPTAYHLSLKEDDQDQDQEVKYVYLNDQELAQSFDPNPTKEYSVFICICNIESDCDIPFLKFLMTFDNETIDFPKIQYQPPVVSRVTAHQGDEDETPHVVFINECIAEVLALFPIHESFSQDMTDSIYKGYIEYKEAIYVVFDISRLDVDKRPPDIKKHRWVIMDEIEYNKLVSGKPISQDSLAMFKENPHLTHLYDDNKKRLLRPLLMYGCYKERDDNDQEGDIYHNRPIVDDNQSIDIIEDTIDHSWFGDYYYFSSVPIDPVLAVDKLCRYAVFVLNARYILKPIEDIDDVERSRFDRQLDETDQEKNNMTIYFRENTIQLWCIKTEGQYIEIDM